jgi:hypothetical protein
MHFKLDSITTGDAACRRLYVCLSGAVPAALSAVTLKVLSDNSAEVLLNGAPAYKDPAADHEPA